MITMKDKKIKEKKEKFFNKRTRTDGGIEVEMTKTPAKTTTGKIFITLIVLGTVLVPLAVAVWIIVAFIKG